MTLRDYSLTKLRGMAQSYDVKDIFTKDAPQLVQAIESKQQEQFTPVVTEVSRPEYDPRLMTKIPAKRSDRELAEEVMAPYIERGLTFTIDDIEESWAMAFVDRRDSGTLRQPPRIIARCAERLINGN